VKSYSEHQKALALEILARHDGQVTSVALSDIRELLESPDLPKTTVWRWLQRDATDKKNVTPEAKAKAAETLDNMFEATARQYLSHAQKETVVNRMDGKGAVIAAATAVDKMRLLRDLPTEIIGATAELTELAIFFRENNIEMSTAIRDWRERLQARKAAIDGKVSNG
jgi:hypothetical protein